MTGFAAQKTRRKRLHLPRRANRNDPILKAVTSGIGLAQRAYDH